jgi:hypothetical protein
MSGSQAQHVGSIPIARSTLLANLSALPRLSVSDASVFAVAPANPTTRFRRLGLAPVAPWKILRASVKSKASKTGSSFHRCGGKNGGVKNR